MKAYYFKVEGLKKIHTMFAKDDQDFLLNYKRVVDGSTVIFSTDKKLVRTYKPPKKIIPQCILEFDIRVGLGIGEAYEDERLSDSDYTKPFLVRSSWGSGDSCGFATREEVIATIIESKESNEDNSFDLEIYEFPSGEEVGYAVEYTVTLK